MRPGFMIYYDDYSGLLEDLDFEELGKLFFAVFLYARTGQKFEFEKDERLIEVIFNSLIPRLDADRVRYESVCEKKRKAANARWDKSDAGACTCMQADA